MKTIKKVAVTTLPETTGAIIDSFNTSDDKHTNAPSLNAVEGKVNDVNTKIDTRVTGIEDLITDEFDSSRSYDINTLVMKEHKLYECTTEYIAGPSADFNTSFTATDILSQLAKRLTIISNNASFGNNISTMPLNTYARYNPNTVGIPSKICTYGTVLKIQSASGYLVLCIGNVIEQGNLIALNSYINNAWTGWHYISDGSYWNDVTNRIVPGPTFSEVYQQLAISNENTKICNIKYNCTIPSIASVIDLSIPIATNFPHAKVSTYLSAFNYTTRKPVLVWITTDGALKIETTSNLFSAGDTLIVSGCYPIA